MSRSYLDVRVLRSTGALVAVAWLLGGAAVGVASGRSRTALPTVFTGHAKHQFVRRAGTISYTGDGSGEIGGPNGTSVTNLGHLLWTQYGPRTGRARGLVWLDDCNPDCASGTFDPYPVGIYVSDPQHGHFAMLTLKYTYAGKKVVDRRFVQDVSGFDNPSQKFWQYGVAN